MEIHTKLNTKIAAIGVLAAALLPATGIPSFAQSELISPSEWEELSPLSPELSPQEFEQQITDWAKANGQDPSATVQQVLGEARQMSKEADEYEATELTASKSGNSKGGNGNLPAAKRKGDVFYTPSKTSGMRHGHSGIYVSTEEIVEAPGRGKRAHQVHIKSTNYPKKGTLRQYVKTSNSQRAAAANKAKTYIGHPYNDNFLENKKDDGTPGQPVNCSQLVWLAYFMSYHPSVPARKRIDLDSNGGPGVYPWNIRDSRWTKTYE